MERFDCYTNHFPQPLVADMSLSMIMQEIEHLSSYAKARSELGTFYSNSTKAEYARMSELKGVLPDYVQRSIESREADYERTVNFKASRAQKSKAKRRNNANAVTGKGNVKLFDTVGQEQTDLF